MKRFIIFSYLWFGNEEGHAGGLFFSISQIQSVPVISRQLLTGFFLPLPKRG